MFVNYSKMFEYMYQNIMII